MRALRRLLFVLLVLGIAAWFTRTRWLTAIGQNLTREDRREPVDAVLVLAGDSRGSRILKACELLHDEVAPIVLVSGPMQVYGVSEADLAINFARSHGCSSDALQPVNLPALSTQDEARNMDGEFQRRGIRRVAIVTSNYHTARSGRIFEQQLGGRVKVLMVAAPDEYFSPGTWWHTREGQKITFYEYSKTIAGAVGL